MADILPNEDHNRQNAEVLTLKMNLSIQRKINSALEERNEHMTEQLKDKDEAIDTLKKKLNDREAEHATLNISLSAAVKKNREDQKQLTKKDKKIKELKNTLQKLESSLAEKNNIVSSLRKKEKEHVSLMEQLEYNDDVIDILGLEFKSLLAKHAELKKLYYAAAERNRTDQTKLLKKDEKIKELENTVKELESSLATKTMMKEKEQKHKLSFRELLCNILEVVYSLELKSEMFYEVVKRINQWINTSEKLKLVVDMIYDQAIAQPQLCSEYAKLCCELSHLESGDEENIEFDFLLSNKCHIEFNKNVEVNYYCQKQLLRKRALGNIKFIGELFKLKMLTEAFIDRCVEKLLKNGDEDSLMFFCQLLTIIGKDLDQRAKPRTDQYFYQINKAIRQQAISPQIRIMVQNLQELRAYDWIPVGKRHLDPVDKRAPLP